MRNIRTGRRRGHTVLSAAAALAAAAAAILWAQAQTLQQESTRLRQQRDDATEQLQQQQEDLEVLRERIIQLADEKAGEQDRADAADALSGQLQESGTEARSIAEQALQVIEDLNLCLAGHQEWNRLLQGALDGQRYDQQAVQATADSINSVCGRAQQEIEALNLLISRTR